MELQYEGGKYAASRAHRPWSIPANGSVANRMDKNLEILLNRLNAHLLSVPTDLLRSDSLKVGRYSE